jgi:2'-5' RNA ligase
MGFTITGFGCFTSDPRFDVLYLSVESDDLMRLNAALAEHSSHGEYKPHMTLAYLRKGLVQDILHQVESVELDVEVPMRCFELSRADGLVEYVNL